MRLAGPGTEYVVVFGIERVGRDYVTCTLDPDEFLTMVSEFIEGHSAPCCEQAQITVTSMPREKWERYGEEEES